MYKKFLIYFFIIFGIAVAYWAYFRETGDHQVAASAEPQGKNEEKESGPEVLSVKSEISQAKNVEIFEEYAGVTSPFNDADVESQVSGYVQSIHVQEGDYVEQGQLLFTISDDGRTAKLKAAESEFRLRYMQYQSAKKLEAKKFTSPISLATAEYNLERAKLALDMAKTDHKRLRVLAPFSGVVQKIYVDPNQSISPSLMNVKLCHLVGLSPLYIFIEVPEMAYLSVQNIKEALVKLPNGREEMAVRDFISSLAQQKTKTFPMRFKLQNRDYKLPSGLSVDVRIPKVLQKVHMIQPSWVVLSSSGEMGVMVIEMGKAHFVPIQIAHSSKDLFYASGLPNNVEIITRGQNEVIEGADVRNDNLGTH